MDSLGECFESGTCRLAAEEQADLLAGIFWIGVCLLDSDYEYEYLAGIRLLSRLLPCISSTAPSLPPTGRKWPSQQQQQRQSIPDLHDHVLKLLHRLKWSSVGTSDETDYPGLLSLLLKGCFSSTLIDAACRLLVQLIPVVKSPVVDPNTDVRHHYRRAAMRGASRSNNPGSSSSYPGSLASLVISLLPMMLIAWDEDPDNTSTSSEAAPSVVESCESCGDAHGSPAVGSNCFASPSPPPPLGSWVHRGMVLSEASVPSPSSGLLSLITSNITSGAIAKKAPQLRPKNPICIQVNPDSNIDKSRTSSSDNVFSSP